MSIRSRSELQARAAQLSDEALVEEILAGQQTYLAALYDRYSNKVYYKCLSVVKEPAVAKDLSHDIFVKILANLRQFRGRSKLSFWIYAVTYNHCMEYLRKRKRLFTEPVDERAEVLADESDAELADKQLHDLRLDQLARLLPQLREDEKLVLLMRYQDGMSVKQICQVLQLGQSAVKMRLKRGRDRLAKLLNALSDAE